MARTILLWMVWVNTNPAKDVLTLNLSGREDLTGFRNQNLTGLKGTLLTADGRPVKAFILTGEKNTINISGLQPGVYLLQIETQTGNVVKRVVVQ